MSISTVKSGLDSIAETIRTERQAAEKAKERLSTALNNINSLPTVYADDIAEINAYAGSDPFEALSQDELAKMTTEFQALKAVLQSAVTALGSLSF